MMNLNHLAMRQDARGDALHPAQLLSVASSAGGHGMQAYSSEVQIL